MLGNILQRMIFWELFKVFMLSLIGITGLLLLAGIIAEASQQGLGPAQIVSIIPLLIPSTLPYTIPVTTLFATCVVYGRLSANNEILAIRASGINLLMAIRPAITLGLITTGITMGLYFHVIPYTHHLMRSMFLDDVEGLLYAALEQKREVRHSRLNSEMYVRGVRGRKLINPTFKGRSKDGKVDFVAVAREAELRVDKHKNVIHVLMQNGQVAGKGDSQGLFLERIWEVPIPEDFQEARVIRARDLTWPQLEARKAKLLQETSENQKALELAEARVNSPRKTTKDIKQVTILKSKLKANLNELRSLTTEFHMRPALSVGCLFFVLVGCPVGIWFGKRDYLSSFISCFLPIVLIYYPLTLCGTGLAKEGYNPILTVWSADLALAVLSTFLFWKLVRS